MSVQKQLEKMQAKTCKELADEYGVHVNTVYSMRDKIAGILNLQPGAKRFLPKQLNIFYGYYGRP